MFKNIYQGKRVFVKGHTGFKGSWLCIWLKELGAEVVGYALDPPSEPNNFSTCRLSEHIDHQYGDVRDYNHLISIFSHYNPEMVFHLAAQALVRSSYDDPKRTFDTNAGGTVNVLEAVRRTPGVRVVVNVTSDKCYENREWVWGYRENGPLGGHDPYSASKECAELIYNAYLRSFFSQKKSGDTIPISVLRQAQDERDIGSCPQAVHETAALRPCCDKAMASLGWGNALSLTQTIALTADWYKQYYQNSGEMDMCDACAG
jgi:CDP-glucose 4,6-dehydratase